MLTFIGAIGGSELIFLFIIALFILPLIYSIVHIVRNDFLTDTMKLIWVLIVIFVPFGWLLYFIVGAKPK